MSAKFTSDEILYAAAGRIASGGTGSQSGRVVWNLEDISEGDWFLAMSSGNTDTHDQLFDATKLGARGCIVNRQCRYSFAAEGSALISVADTRVALLELARYWRYAVKPQVVAVVGTVRRRTIMAILEVLLKDKMRCHLAFEHPGLGCVPDVLNMPKGTDVLIAEVGGSQRGDVARTANCLAPDLGIIGTTHHPLPSETRDQRAAAMNCEVLDAIRHYEGGRAVVFDDNPAVSERVRIMQPAVPVELYSTNPNIPAGFSEWLSSRVNFGQGQEPQTADLWCAAKAARLLGVSVEHALEVSGSWL